MNLDTLPRTGLPSADLLLKLTALLHGDGVRSFSEHLPHLCEVAVLVYLVFDGSGIVNECEFSLFALEHLETVGPEQCSARRANLRVYSPSGYRLKGSGRARSVRSREGYARIVP